MIRLLAASFFLLLSFAAPAAALPQLNLQFDKLEQALNLTPQQKDQYELAVGATKRLMLAAAIAGMQAKEKLAEELAKPRPDFRELAKLSEAFIDDSRTLRREAREEWQRLYAMLDADQVAAIKEFIDRRIDHLGLLHEFLMGVMVGRR